MITINFRMKVLMLMLLGAASVSLAVQAQAEGYPDRPITWVVPYPPGGTTDTVARNIADVMAPLLGTSIVVENKAGAGGQIAMAYVARSKPDGYTLLVSDASLSTAPSLYKSMQVDPLKDLAAVSLFVTVPHVLVVNPEVKVASLSELVALTKKYPGKLDFGSGGVGSPLHLAGAALKLAAGLQWTHVPYKGAGPAILAAISHQVDVATPSLPSALPQISAGKLRALAVTSPARISVLPDIPTVGELGYPKATVFGWVGLHAPAGIPEEANLSLQKAAAEAMKNTDLVERLRSLGADITYKSSDAYAKLVSDEAVRWDGVVKRLGLTPQ
ncbi:tripartite tricarboxylate transporter substrate binding protein [Allopusillimonas soli]|uniref:Tripartite tricarboxylate transporter substrate binding protein n=1 Tax=Allopusillimonas soli TaxID=659016 RepID=A0A853F7D6_9BURK|nr:tripartite tricarboxylate transporter substrate binding protein [Allopusillimonas soli]NYT36504.1 tripartite tricarboxylate transporter substrate binding protein [Allopusillimonas soli]TEA75007.1 tripartite tricarboxylate transporter substrate binding protein [Allopusillimonas soli]